VKFLYSDTQDYVDPEYDFVNDRNAPGRQRYWDDQYAHELLGHAPYDGLLVAISAVKKSPGVANSKTRYSLAEAQRFLRSGARKFLRFDTPQFQPLMLMGDCGAFAYADQAEPAYSVDEVFEFYEGGGFTHGCSPDHVIFDFDTGNPPESSVDPAVLKRYEVTLANAQEFLAVCTREGMPFVPLGAVQGWSPGSMAEAAHRLEEMGYRYLAIGGLVPLRPDAIHLCLKAIRNRVSTGTSLHLLGFAKAEQIDQFLDYGIASFDSTSPLIRAFKDARANYYLESPGGGLEYYAAIRVPQAVENARLMRAVKTGAVSAEDLLVRETRTLDAIRAYARGIGSAEVVAEQVIDYQRCLSLAEKPSAQPQIDREIAKSLDQTLRSLRDRPWERCSCPICSKIGIEVLLFRGSNRNKRRGMHNLDVYHRHLQRVIGQLH
jgi:hypothetical protein